MSHNTRPLISPVQQSDYNEWSRLFDGYLTFYKTSLPDSQYTLTFSRLCDPNSDLYGLVMRGDEEGTLIGLAHFYPHQTPWSEKQIMHLNDLFVDPEIRGKGYGRMLIEAVEAEARKKGCYRLQWTTQHGNPARKLYDQIAKCEFVQYRKELS